MCSQLFLSDLDHIVPSKAKRKRHISQHTKKKVVQCLKNNIFELFEINKILEKENLPSINSKQLSNLKHRVQL